jgi:hypothetical protein
MQQASESLTTARVDQRPAPAMLTTAAAMRRPPGMLITVGVVAIIVLAVGGYKFNWTWTGFKGNTLWDWLHLLLLPVALTLATVGILRHHTWQRSWTVIAAICGVAIIILAIGGYVMDWTWTGFKGNTFWDWLELFLLPVVLSVVTAWFSVSSAPENGALGAALSQQLIQSELEEAAAPHD